MSFNYTYQIYDRLALAIPAVALVTSPVIVFTAANLMYCSIKCFDQNVPYVWIILREGLKLLYEDTFKQPEPNIYTLHGVILSKWRVIALFSSYVMIWCCTVVSFWSELLVSESSQCDSRMDCFAVDKSSGKPDKQDPLGNTCTEFENNDGYTIECYTLAFNYISAIGNAGSVLLLGSVIMKIQPPLVFVTVLKKKTIIGQCGIAILLLYYSVTFILITILFGALLARLEVVSSVVLRNSYTKVQFAAYCIPFCLAHATAGPCVLIRCRSCGFAEIYQASNEDEKKTN